MSYNLPIQEHTLTEAEWRRGIKAAYTMKFKTLTIAILDAGDLIGYGAHVDPDPVLALQTAQAHAHERLALIKSDIASRQSV
jgi:hypothetical protein